MLGYIFSILAVLVVLAAGVILFAKSGSGRADASQPRLDERKGTSLRHPVAEEPDISRRHGA